jgi:hypothetical protein
MLVVLAALVLVVGLARNHAPSELAALGGLLVLTALVIRLLGRDLRAHPSGFPEATPSHAVRMRDRVRDADEQLWISGR